MSKTVVPKPLRNALIKTTFVALWLVFSCDEKPAVQLDRALYCANMCDYAVRCDDADRVTCEADCKSNFLLDPCAQDNFLATPFEVYSECVKRLDCSQPESSCQTDALEKDPLAAQCEAWMDGCYEPVDHTMCTLTPFMTDEFRAELRVCLRDACDSPEIYERCSRLPSQCF